MDRQLLLLAFFHLAASHSCPQNEVPFGGKCYFYNVTKVNILSAEDICWRKEYNLVEINSAEENMFVQDTMQNTMTTVWLGTNRQGFWRTSLTNKELDYINWLPWDDFTNLSANCALIDGSGDWKSVNCEMKDQVMTMCERQVGQNCLDRALSFQGKCYFQSLQTMTKESGDRFCQDVGFTLLEVNNDEEDEFIKNITLAEDRIAFWIGIKRHIVWTTISRNEEVTYTNWQQSFPVDQYEARCALITDEGHWRNLGCNDRASVMCESRPTYVCPQNARIFRENCYVFGDVTSDMASSEVACHNLGFELVVINDAEENNYILDQIIGNRVTAGWLGLYSLISWVTLPDMRPLPYTHWGAGYPDDDPQGLCVFMDGKGYWKNVDCTNTTAAIMMCEKKKGSQDCLENAKIFKGKQYLIGVYNADMRTSEDVCAYVGFEIVVIDDAEENDYIRDYIARNNLTGGWLGVYWREPLTVLPNMEEARYTNWTSGYPRGDGECVYMDSTGYWKNIRCENLNKAVVMCQKNQAGHDCPENVEVFRGNRYLFGAHPVNFTNAMGSCAYLGFKYVVIDDDEETKAIRDYLTEKKLTGGWIGVFWNGSAAFLLDYETARYTNWAAGYPSGDGDCVYMDSTGYWKNILCWNETRAVVMCEKESGMTQSVYSTHSVR